MADLEAEETAEETEELAEEIASAVEESIEEASEPETDIDITVIEAPEPEEADAKFASVDVGDLHISGPAEMVEKVTAEYLKKHLDHNPHETVHSPVDEPDTTVIDETAAAVTPDVVEEAVEQGAAADIAPEPDDWLFRSRST